jgi:hypothetical protein
MAIEFRAADDTYTAIRSPPSWGSSRGNRCASGRGRLGSIAVSIRARPAEIAEIKVRRKEDAELRRANEVSNLAASAPNVWVPIIHPRRSQR